MKYKKFFPIIGIIFIAIFCVILFLSKHIQIISVTINPEIIIKNTPQEITVWVTVKSELLSQPFFSITASLVEQGSEFNVFNNNKVTLGKLVKQNKDSSGNNVYKGIFIINHPKAETVQIQLQDNFGRNITPQNDIPVMRLAIPTRQFTLPPDPGEAGKLTLEGIDSDNDGLRDDIQREIFFAYPESERARKAWGDKHKSDEKGMLNSNNREALRYISYSAGKRTMCLVDLGISPSPKDTQFFIFINSVIFNTKMREQAGELASFNISNVIPSAEELKLGNCLFDQNSLLD